MPSCGAIPMLFWAASGVSNAPDIERLTVMIYAL